MQGQYASSKEKGGRLGFIWVVVLVLVAVVAVVAVRPRPDVAQEREIERLRAELAAERAKVETLSLEQPESTQDDGEAGGAGDPELDQQVELLRLEAELEQAQGRIERLEDQNAQLASQVESYRQGLERAVDELNRQTERAAPRSTSRRASRDADPQFVVVRDPYVTVVGMSRIDVEGTVHNANSESAAGFVYLTLFQGSREIDSTRIRMEIRGRTVREYDYTFSGGFASGEQYRVDAEWAAR